MTSYTHGGFTCTDKEWFDAVTADERPVLYKCQMGNGGVCYKQYKPSVARLFAKRTGLKMEIVEMIRGEEQ